MEPSLACTLLAVALVGNTAWWITFLNRSHGLGVWRPLVHCCSALSLAGLVGGPLILLVAALAVSPDATAFLPKLLATSLGDASRSPLAIAAETYAALCLLVAVVPFPLWILSGWLRPEPAQLRSQRVDCLDFARLLPDKTLTHGAARLAAALPGNEVFKVELNDKTLALPHLPPALSGLSIAHLSDLHMSGRIGIDFFHEMVDRTNAMTPDLIAITGDIVDSVACLEWIGPMFGRLRAPLGVYCILGNHDVCVDLDTLRSKIAAAGVTNLGGCSRRLDVAGEGVLLTGNELPWIHPASETDGADRHDESCSLRILLAHSPDQIGWARRRHYELMLAGHTHGGQIRLPGVGAVLAPSIFGTKYAAGLFYEAPTLMHVSRGVSGLTPVRYNCRPEISLLRLLATSASPRNDDAALDAEEAIVSGS